MKDRNPIVREVRTVPEHLPAMHGGFVGPDFSMGEEAQLREYWRVIWKYRTIIGLAVGACTIFALIYAFTLTPRYTASSKIRISTYEPILAATKIEDMLQEKSKEATYFETQIQEIRSLSLADKVLEDPSIKEGVMGSGKQGMFSGVFGASNSSDDSETVDGVAGYKTPVKYLKAYLDQITVEPVRRTSLVAINSTSEDPKLAALIANKHALAYIDWVRENRMEQQSRGLTFLRGQADELKEKVTDLDRELADYAEANSIVAINKDENVTVQKMAQLNRLLTDTTAKRIELENAYKEAEAALENSSAGFEDSSTQSMRTQLATLEAEYQQLGTKFTPSYPRMQQLASQIAGIKNSLKTQRQQIVVGMKAKAQAAAEEEKRLKEEVEQQTSQAFELSKRQVQYNVLKRELTSSRDLLQNVLKQIKETSLAVESNSSNVSVVDAAVVPKAPSFPRKRLIALFGVLVGLSLGLGIAFLLNYLDNSVRTPEDVQTLIKLPCLGVVPSFDIIENIESPGANERASADLGVARDPGGLIRADESGLGLPIVYLKDPKSLASEAYRTIRTGLLLSQAGEPPRTILVSSAQSSEGKTTSSINLAASLASAGGRVILVDADLRRPSVNKYFRLEPNLPGLVEMITGQATFAEVARPDLVRRITILPAGRIPPNPAELLGSLEMAAIIDDLAGQFDYVIIDSPPILPVTDSVILSRYVDGVVLVVKGASTPRKVVKDARDRLLGVGARFLGIVLNDVDLKNGDYYYYNRYYHAYYQEDAANSSEATRRAAS